jgi:prohibitin 1
MKNKKGQMEIFLVLSIVVVCLFIVMAFVFKIVNYNEYAYEREFGKLKYDLKEQGIRYIGFGSLVRVNNQVRNYEVNVDSASKDLQQVSMILNLNIRIKKDKVRDFILNYPNEETYNSYLNNKIQERAKMIVLKYQAEEFIFNREVIRNELLKELNNIEELEYFVLNDLAIKDIQFSPEFSRIIEQRAQVSIERETIIRQKENMQLIQDNFKIISSEDYFKYKIAEKWDGTSPLTIIN